MSSFQIGPKLNKDFGNCSSYSGFAMNYHQENNSMNNFSSSGLKTSFNNKNLNKFSPNIMGNCFSEYQENMYNRDEENYNINNAFNNNFLCKETNSGNNINTLVMNLSSLTINEDYEGKMPFKRNDASNGELTIRPRRRTGNITLESYQM